MVRRVSEPIMRPFCALCAKLMSLSRIDFDGAGLEQRTYRCPSCGKTELIETLARGSSPIA